MTNWPEPKGPKPAKVPGKDKKSTFGKIVIRRLPPSMREEALMEQLSPLPEHDYFYFVGAEVSLEPHAFSRAYINITSSLEDICIFREKFDGYVFVDELGNEYPALVEFAPYQKIPKNKSQKKKDAKMNTIEDDPDFLQFKEMVEEREKGYHFTLDQHLEEIQIKEKEKASLEKKSTPLLEFLKEKQAEKKRIRDEKRGAKKKKDEEKRKTNKDFEKKPNKRDAKKDKDKKKTDKPEGKKILLREKTEEGQHFEVQSHVSKKESPPKSDKFKRDKPPKRVPKEPGQDGDKFGGRRRDNERPMMKEKRERIQHRDAPMRPPRDALGTDRGLDHSPKPLTKPKRYSDRRKEEKIKREMAKNPDASEDPSPMDPMPEPMSKMTFIGEFDPEQCAESSLSEEQIQRREEIKAKREAERQLRKERLKNKERPEMQIYRPGMGKFSSKTIREGGKPRELSGSDGSSSMGGGEDDDFGGGSRRGRGRYYIRGGRGRSRTYVSEGNDN